MTARAFSLWLWWLSVTCPPTASCALNVCSAADGNLGWLWSLAGGGVLALEVY